MNNKQHKIRNHVKLSTKIALAAITLLAVNCKKEDPILTPEMGGITVPSGYIGQEVTINGKNFNDGATNTTVKFDEVVAKIKSGTKETIVTTVPEGVPFGKVMVKVKIGEFNELSTEFTVLNPADTIKPYVFESFAPKSGGYGEEVTLKGQYFTSDIEVYVNGIRQSEVSFISDKEIKVKLAKGTGSGIIELKRGNEPSKKSGETFEYKFKYSLEKEKFSKFPASGIAAKSDGTFYIAYGDNLFHVDASDKVLDTIIDANDLISAANGLFMDSNKILYVTDFEGRILAVDLATHAVDTIIGTNDPNMDSYCVSQLTGDGKGYLYVAGLVSKKVLKVDIKAKTTEVLATAQDDVYAIELSNDSLYVVVQNEILKLSQSGTNQAPVTVLAKDKGYVFQPADIIRHQSGNFIIVTEGTDGVYSLSPNGKLSKQLDISGRALTVDHNGDFLIATNSGIEKLKVE